MNLNNASATHIFYFKIKVQCRVERDCVPAQAEWCSAQVVAVLMRHGCWLLSVQLNNINSQSQGHTTGPEDHHQGGLGKSGKPRFHAYLHKCNRYTHMFYFNGEILQALCHSQPLIEYCGLKSVLI